MNRRSWFAALFAAPVAVIAGMRGAGKPKLQELRVALNLDTSRFSAGMGRVEADRKSVV